MRLGLALLVALAGLSCVRNYANEQQDGVCEVHNARLSTSIVRLGYGLPTAPGIAYRTARKAEFPHSHLYANGGCVSNPFFRWARVRACPKCNAAEKEWLKTHRREPAEGEKSPLSEAAALQPHSV
jgi:hypothetical protein